MKSPFVYWFWRLYFVSVWLIFATIGLTAVTLRDDTLFFIALGCMPFFSIVVIQNLNLGAFPFAYSVFGKYRRTPLPDEPPVAVIRYSSATVGRLNTGPGLKWLLYRQGIGIRIPLMIGTAFIWREEIESLDLDCHFRATLTHCCPEVRGPIKVPKKAAKIMAGYYPEKVLVEAEAA